MIVEYSRSEDVWQSRRKFEARHRLQRVKMPERDPEGTKQMRMS